MLIVFEVWNVIKYRSIWINVRCFNIYVLSLHVENLCLGDYSVYKYSREKPVLCDLTIYSGRARFGGLDSSGRRPYCVIWLLRETPMLFVCLSLTSLCHSNGHIETMPAREINPFTALTRIRSQFLRTQWSTSNHSEWTQLRVDRSAIGAGDAHVV